MRYYRKRYTPYAGRNQSLFSFGTRRRRDNRAASSLMPRRINYYYSRNPTVITRPTHGNRQLNISSFDNQLYVDALRNQGYVIGKQSSGEIIAPYLITRLFYQYNQYYAHNGDPQMIEIVNPQVEQFTFLDNSGYVDGTANTVYIYFSLTETCIQVLIVNCRTASQFPLHSNYIEETNLPLGRITISTGQTVADGMFVFTFFAYSDTNNTLVPFYVCVENPKVPDDYTQSILMLPRNTFVLDRKFTNIPQQP